MRGKRQRPPSMKQCPQCVAAVFSAGKSTPVNHQTEAEAPALSAPGWRAANR